MKVTSLSGEGDGSRISISSSLDWNSGSSSYSWSSSLSCSTSDSVSGGLGSFSPLSLGKTSILSSVSDTLGLAEPSGSPTFSGVPWGSAPCRFSSLTALNCCTGEMLVWLGPASGCLLAFSWASSSARRWCSLFAILASSWSCLIWILCRS